jgi:hypothetical protein
MTDFVSLQEVFLRQVGTCEMSGLAKPHPDAEFDLLHTFCQQLPGQSVEEIES